MQIRDVALAFFIVKLNADGSCDWLKGYAHSVSSTILYLKPCMVSDDNANIYLKVPYTGNVCIGLHKLTACDKNNSIFLLKMDLHGRIKWILDIKGMNENQNRDISVNV